MTSSDTPPWEDEAPPLALTEAHLPALAAAIHAEGYRIMVDTETGEVKLEPSGDLLTIKEKADLYDEVLSAAQDGPI